MTNMSYCRFENTLNDLCDCEDALTEIMGNIEQLESESERRCAQKLIKVCKRIASDYADEN